MSVDVVTFGCRLNSFESEVMRRHADEAGRDNVIIFNTCAVTQEATRQARQAIRKARKENPDAEIIVTGCAAQTEAEIFAALPEVSRVIGNTEKLRATSWIKGSNGPRVEVSDIMVEREARPPMISKLTGRTRAFVQVQNGCDHRCTFCIIPFGRGNSRSVAVADVVAQVRKLVDEGYREIVLSGVDLTSWGADLEGGPKLGRLISTLLKAEPALERLRLSSIDSIEADDELVDLVTGEKRVMPHLHLSLQSGDDMILKRMKRRHSRSDSIAFCQMLRAKRPDMVFGADLIAGFPTETDVMFENSLKLVDECGLTYLHVFPYSARPGTPAAKMPQIDSKIVKGRAARLRHKGETQLSTFHAAQVGHRFEVLAETPTLGRTQHFAQVSFEHDVVPGMIFQTEITGVANNRLSGAVV
jgi:threonylcarbamoyladenosine tRNA methylthiotransferase MtaB